MMVADLLGEVVRMTRRDAALRFAAAGLPVFVCVPGGKRPLTRHGFHDATIEASQIQGWFDRWPEANLAIPTGGARFDVVDVDVRPSGSGMPTLRRADAAGLLDGWACRVTTPSGGQHLYFNTEPSRQQRSWTSAGTHIDFRGDGGYVLVPPSAVDTPAGPDSYRLCATGTGSGRVDAGRLRRFLTPPAGPSPPPSGPARSSRARWEGLATWVATRPEGTRNASLFWAACRVAEAGAAETPVMLLLRDAALRSGLGEREVTATIRSASHTIGSASPQPVVRRPQHGLSR